MARLLLIQSALLAAGAVILQLVFGGEALDLFAPGPIDHHMPVLDVALGVGTGLLVVLASRLSSTRVAWARLIDEEFRELLRPISVRSVPSLAVMSAVSEEMFFRGFLQPHLGLVVTSVLFGLAHVPHNRRLVPWTFAAVLMGLAFGWMFETRGALLAPVLAHFTINYFNLHHLLRPRAEEPA